jgi:hypothetical protein
MLFHTMKAIEKEVDNPKKTPLHTLPRSLTARFPANEVEKTILLLNGSDQSEQPYPINQRVP